MRVTADVKKATRDRIVESARKLFSSKGFDQTTTRDLARAAGIASGTLFNYFPAKEDIAMELVAEALHRGRDDFERRTGHVATLDEALFAYVATGLRALKPCRGFIRPALETAFSAVAGRPSGESLGGALRAQHLEQIHAIAVKHGLGEQLSPIALQLYWTLYTGVLAFWADDPSPHQEDTLALLDESLRMFVSWLRSAGGEPGEDDDDDG